MSIYVLIDYKHYCETNGLEFRLEGLKVYKKTHWKE